MKPKTNFLLTFFSIFYFLLSSNIYAQYKIFAWENFEGDKLSDSLTKFGKGAEENIYIAKYYQITGFPNVLEGIAKTECGMGCMFIRTQPSARYLRVVSSDKLDRSRLKDVGTAIVQADFYIKEISADMVGVALVATEIDPNTPTILNRFYRLGISDNGDIYFSFFDGLDPQNEEKLKNFPRENINNYQLKIPGWHRFQMVFRGQKNIHCYLDGKETSFSPIPESTLKSLQMGVMTASKSTTNSYITLVDNLSIQIADEEQPLPISPWRKDYSPTSNNPLSSSDMSNMQSSSNTNKNIIWYRTSDDAVAANAQKKMPYLILFYSPFAKANAFLEKIFQTDKSAQSFLQNYILVSIDVNQLGGGSLAETMKVYKFPFFVILNSNGQELSRAIFTKEMNWEELSQKLKSPKN